MPDPYDQVPAGEGIHNYYTGFTYGGISIAILEDRKFKVPPSASERSDRTDLSLLGATQEKFLEEWGRDWRGAEMKVVVSQTIYASAQTGREGGGIITTDADSNGYPKPGRDRAVDLFRRARALLVSGDQHLASVMQLGIEEAGDGPYQFCVPAVASIFWRYFYPSEPGLHRDEGMPDYTGDFVDGFGNHFRVIAVANPQALDVYRAGIPDGMDYPPSPREQGRSDRYSMGDGYGIVRFDKINKTATIECWPQDARHADMRAGDGQYAGWPIKVQF